jgi:hypothetical protein
MYACDYDGHDAGFVKVGSGVGRGCRLSVVGGRWKR